MSPLAFPHLKLCSPLLRVLEASRSLPGWKSSHGPVGMQGQAGTQRSPRRTWLLLAVGAEQPNLAAASSQPWGQPCAASLAPSGSLCPLLQECPDGMGTGPAPGEKGTVGNNLLSKAR